MARQRSLGGENDAPSRNLSRFLDTLAERLPAIGLDVMQVWRNDRFGRGGDHTEFLNAGYPAVRAAVNAAIAGGTITGVTAIDNEASMSEPGSPGVLRLTYEADNGGNADHLHTNLAGRTVNAGNLRTALEAADLL